MKNKRTTKAIEKIHDLLADYHDQRAYADNFPEQNAQPSGKKVLQDIQEVLNAYWRKTSPRGEGMAKGNMTPQAICFVSQNADADQIQTILSKDGVHVVGIPDTIGEALRADTLTPAEQASIRKYLRDRETGQTIDEKELPLWLAELEMIRREGIALARQTVADNDAAFGAILGCIIECHYSELEVITKALGLRFSSSVMELLSEAKPTDWVRWCSNHHGVFVLVNIWRNGKIVCPEAKESEKP